MSIALRRIVRLLSLLRQTATLCQGRINLTLLLDVPLDLTRLKRRNLRCKVLRSHCESNQKTVRQRNLLRTELRVKIESTDRGRFDIFNNETVLFSVQIL